MAWRKVIEFFVEGKPAPQGSKQGFALRKGGQLTGKVAMIESSKALKPWRQTVACAARDAMKDKLPSARAIWMNSAFYFSRPKAHYGTGKNERVQKPSAPINHKQKPDRSKLLRAVEDAIEGIVFLDDCQCMAGRIEKEWAHRFTGRQGVMIEVMEWIN